jgi:predicted transcriptional regulator
MDPRPGVRAMTVAIASRRSIALRSDLEHRILAVLADRTERYSLEIALALGMPKYRCPTILSRLRVLEKQGRLVSRSVRAGQEGCKSGTGRRYFKLVMP